jgi:hypothetical protein
MVHQLASLGVATVSCLPRNAAQLARRRSIPAAGDAHGLAAQPRAGGMLSGSLVRRVRCTHGSARIGGAYVRRATLAVALAACVGTASACDAKSDGSSVVPSEKYTADDIVRIRLEIIADGHFPSEIWQRIIDVAPDGTRMERSPATSTESPAEWGTSVFEWDRLCRFVIDTQLFGTPGLAHVYNGGSRHMGIARVTVSFSDGVESSVGDAAFHAHGEPPFWTLVRVIEGGVLGEKLEQLEASGR